MKCFYSFKDKQKLRKQKSDPTLESRRESSSSSGTRVTQSSGSITSLKSPRRSVPELYQEKAHNLRVFTLWELKRATNGFNRLLKIGEGGFGTVYKGFIKPVNGQGAKIPVAIKNLKRDGLQGHKQWLAEIQFLGIVEHPTLVKLIGYCAIDDQKEIQRLLVYEYMANRSLEDHLFNQTLPVLPWNTRLQIILDAAQGLAYLHEELEVQVIYRDFKASNILLDETFKPKLSDFGLAREGPPPDQTHVSTGVMGTHGYAAPDYIETGHLTTKSDVWSFGVVLYELLTGRRTVERNRPINEQSLLNWVKHFPTETHRFRLIIDPRLGSQFSLRAAQKIAKLADNCLANQARNRPRMSEVVEVLKEAIEITGRITQNQIPETSDEESCMEDRDSHTSNGSNYVRRMSHLENLRKISNEAGMRRLAVIQKNGV